MCNAPLYRTSAGTAFGKAKAAGVYKGCPASVEAARFFGASGIAKALKIGRASVYRVLDAGQ